MRLQPDQNHTRGYLPHFVKPGASYFVTFRLADSLPREVLEELQNELNELASRPVNDPRPNDSKAARTLDLDRERRKLIEFHLDRGIGSCCLKNEKIAAVACDTLNFFDGQRYELGEWVIMPNHVHAVVKPTKQWTLSSILQSWKLKIAREANAILEKTGERFWQPQSFDRIIRDNDEMVATGRYIRRNPVNAGLCANEEEWRWGSAWRLRKKSGAATERDAHRQIGKSALHFRSSLTTPRHISIQ